MIESETLQKPSYWEMHYSPVCENRLNGKVLEAYLDVATRYQRNMLAEAPSAETSPFAYFSGRSVYNIPADKILVTKEFCEEYKLLGKATLIDPERKIYSVEWGVFVNQVRPTENEILRLLHLDECIKNFNGSFKRIQDAALKRKIKDYKPKPLNPTLTESEVPAPLWIRYQEEVRERRLREKNSAIYTLRQNVNYVKETLRTFDLVTTQLVIKSVFNVNVVKSNFNYLIQLCIQWLPNKESLLKEIAKKFTDVHRFDYLTFEDYYLRLIEVYQELLNIIDVMDLIEFRDKQLDLIERFKNLTF